MPKEDDESPIQFPCDFPVKIMGKASLHFEEQVMNIILRHYPDNSLSNVVKRQSKSHNYIAITITVHAKSKAEVDALYEDLTRASEVIMVL